MVFELIIGIGIICALVLYIAFNVDKDHKYLKLTLIGLVFFVLLLIPKDLMLNKDFCSAEVANTTTMGNITSYGYKRVCFTNITNTSDTLYKIVLWFIRLFMVYIVLYSFWVYAVKPLIDLSKKKDFFKK